MSKKPTTQEMTANNIGISILQALVQEVKLLPNVWPKMSKAKQDDVIDRLRNCVIHNVTQAVHLIASQGRVTIMAELEQVTIKDGIKAVLTMSKSDPNRHALTDAQGKAVLLAVADAEDHMGDIAAVKGESDQRAMDLGNEYDPKGDGKGMDGADSDGTVVDAVVKAIDHQPLASELEEAFGDGKLAAQEGKDLNDCPVMNGSLCIEWVKGWKAWQQEHDTDWWQQNKGDGEERPQ